MCYQTVGCCKCCWQNQCGAWVGWGINCFCFSCNLCLPSEMAQIRGGGCCKTGGCTEGFGSMFLCNGQVICIPDWLRRWSTWHTIAEQRGKIYDVEISSCMPAIPGTEIKL